LLHAAVEKIEEEAGRMRGRVQELRAGLAPSSMYGPEHIFLAWQDKCFSKEDKVSQCMRCGVGWDGEAGGSERSKHEFDPANRIDN
jgi:hypothetical protein